MTTDPQPTKTPWYKKWWIWAIVAAVIVIGGIGNLVNGDQEPQAQPTSTTDPAPIPTTTEPAPEETPTEEPAETQEPIGDRVRTALLTELGVNDFPDLLADGRESPLYAIVDIETMYDGTIRVHYQEALTDDQRDEVARHVFNLTAPTVPELDTVVIRDSTGVDSNHRR